MKRADKRLLVAATLTRDQYDWLRGEAEAMGGAPEAAVIRRCIMQAMQAMQQERDDAYATAHGAADSSTGGLDA